MDGGIAILEDNTPIWIEMFRIKGITQNFALIYSDPSI